MADGYWNRQPQQIVPQAGMQKRPRTDYGNFAHYFLFLYIYLANFYSTEWRLVEYVCVLDLISKYSSALICKYSL